MTIKYEEGDLFRCHIEEAIKEGCASVEGDKWGLWGRWVYADDVGLIALFSRAYGSGEPRAYAVRPNYEEIVAQYKFTPRR